MIDRPLSPFASDMRRHFSNELARLMDDTLDTCKRGDASPVDAVTVLLAPLLNNMCSIIVVAGGSEDDLVEIVRACFRTVQRREGMGGRQRERQRQ